MRLEKEVNTMTLDKKLSQLKNTERIEIIQHKDGFLQTIYRGYIFNLRIKVEYDHIKDYTVLQHEKEKSLHLLFIREKKGR